jgi:hypothetical protein
MCSYAFAVTVIEVIDTAAIVRLWHAQKNSVPQGRDIKKPKPGG